MAGAMAGAVASLVVAAAADVPQQRGKVCVHADRKADRDAVDFVTLDGQKVQDCLMADEIHGHVDHFVRDADGRIALELDRQGIARGVVTARKSGVVVVHFKPGYGD